MSNNQGAYKTNRMQPITNEERLRIVQGEILRLHDLALSHPGEPVYRLAVERVKAEAEAIRRVIAAQPKPKRRRTG